jgi:monoamine oxidase
MCSLILIVDADAVFRSALALTLNNAGYGTIVAVPPTVWDDIVITPHHPKELGPHQTGAGSKFFSNLEDRFWIAEGAAPSGVSSDLGLIWEGTDNQMQTSKSEIVLSVYMGGPVFCGPDRDVGYLKRELRKLYPGYTASLRGKNPRLVSWEKEDFIRTGFSCPQKGFVFQVARKLHEPLNDRIFLAGEHTQLNFFGFMEGALYSGRRAAQSVITTVCPQPPTLMA